LFWHTDTNCWRGIAISSVWKTYKNKGKSLKNGIVNDTEDAVGLIKAKQLRNYKLKGGSGAIEGIKLSTHSRKSKTLLATKRQEYESR
jgi:hypothetical protein